MTEEEIIEKIKTYLDIENDGFSGHIEPEIVQALLDLYNKQKEEIEDYKSGYFFTAKQMHYIDEDYIDKVKIIGKIEDLEEKEKNCHFTGLITECEIKIETLKELLEE
jgi:hypothetical protein